MWIPTRVFDWLFISKENVEIMREDLSSLRVERDSLKGQLASVQANFEWLRVRVNAMEVERAQLMNKAYGIIVPVPEIVRTAPKQLELNSALFEDIGEEMAKQLGYPTYNS